MDLTGIQPLFLRIARKLSSPSVCEVSFSLDDIDIERIKTETNYFSIFGFSGVDIQMTQPITVDYKGNKVDITFFDEIALLDTDYLPVSLELKDKNIVNFLNTNTKKIRFENYNLEERTISKTLSKVSFLSILRDFQTEMNFDYWYDGKYYLGTPDQALFLSDEFNSIEIDKQVVNKVIISTDTTKSSFQWANQTSSKYPVFKDDYLDQEYYYIQDMDSIKRYGERVRFIDGNTFEDDEQKIRFSNYSYQEAISILQQESEPKIVVRGLEYYQKEGKLNFNSLVYLNGIDKPFKIADISANYTMDEEQMYNLTLVNQLSGQSKSNYLLKKYEKELRK